MQNIRDKLSQLAEVSNNAKLKQFVTSHCQSSNTP
jgi:hypothetical protein